MIPCSLQRENCHRLRFASDNTPLIGRSESQTHLIEPSSSEGALVGFSRSVKIRDSEPRAARLWKFVFHCKFGIVLNRKLLSVPE